MFGVLLIEKRGTIYVLCIGLTIYLKISIDLLIPEHQLMEQLPDTYSYIHTFNQKLSNISRFNCKWRITIRHEMDDFQVNRSEDFLFLFKDKIFTVV